MKHVIESMNKHQLALYGGSIVAAALCGWLVSGSGQLSVAIEPALALLLTATFLSVPFGRMLDGFKDTKFALAVLALNFVLVPLVVAVLVRAFNMSDAFTVGIALVLLAPCIDYVIVFSGLAGGSRDKLLSLTPVLMIVQMLLLPVYVPLIAQVGVHELFAVEPFLRAFVLLILLPVLVAGALQYLSEKKPSGRAHAFANGMLRSGDAAMVPLMCVTLFLVVASHLGAVLADLGGLLESVVVFVVFACLMTALGIGVGRAVGLPASEAIALTFSGVTRNSLVVLPLGLSVAARFPQVPVVIVTQTLVELVVMVVLLKTLPRVFTRRTDALHKV